MRKFLAYLGYWVLSLTWGLILTTVGILTATVLLITGHKPKRIGPNLYFTIGQNWGGLNLGPIILVSKSTSHHTLYHECGHGIQNIVFGPFMPFLICIPSATRYWYRELRFYRKGLRPKTKYDDIWFEGSATRIGTKIFKKDW